MKRILLIFFVLFLLSFSSSAQQSEIYYGDNATYTMALDLYKKKQYGAAQYYFNHIIRNSSNFNEDKVVNSEYYVAICAIKLFNNDANHLLNEFIRKHPTSNKTQNASFLMAQYQFDRQFYRSALEWFNKLNVYQLDSEKKDEYYFKTGYCLFLLKEHQDARQAFFEIIDYENKYTTAAKYYFGHIAYLEENYETALQNFNQLKKDKNFGLIVPYYITQIYYKQKEYEELISIGNELLGNSIESRKAEISHLLSDAYYKTNNYQEAINKMKEYVTFDGNLSTEDHYQIGFSNFKLKNYQSAIESFNKIIMSSDSIAQNSYYHLAYCYLQTNQKAEAQNAFYEASNFNYSDYIKEDAHFSYVKLSYELTNPYKDPKKDIQSFIKKYPNSKHIDEAYSMLGNIYLNTKHYAKGLELLESTEVSTLKQEIDYQLIAYYRGIELYNNRKWNDALIHFNKSLTYRIDNIIVAEALYWKSEVLYRLKNYTEAITILKEFQKTSGSSTLAIYPFSYYNLGYSYFKIKEYENAAKVLRSFVSEKTIKNNPKLHDALIRIGDAYYISKSYFLANDFYTQAIDINGKDSDYAYFQSAFCNGLLSNNNQKIELLNTFTINYKESRYIDDALYQLGNAHFEKNNIEKALEFYNELIENYAESSYKKQAILKTGLIYYKTNKYELALTTFKEIVNKFPRSLQANEAIDNIRKVYIELGTIEDYISWAEGISFINISEGSLDSATYQAAELAYLKSDYKNANLTLTGYLDKFQNGIFTLNATYYKAACDYYEDNKYIALSGFEDIMNHGQNDFTEDACLYAAKIAYELNLNQKSYDYYKTLAQIAQVPSNLQNATIGLMHTSFNLSKFNEAINYANKVINIETIENPDKQIANIYIAKSYRYSENYSSAINHFNLVIDGSKNRLEAEARLNVAQINFIEQNFKKAKKEIFSLIDKTPSYTDIIAESFILLANIYWLTGDIFQANHTLDMLIKNHEDEWILEEAKKLSLKILNSQIQNNKERINENIEIKLFDINEDSPTDEEDLELKLDNKNE